MGDLGAATEGAGRGIVSAVLVFDRPQQRCHRGMKQIKLFHYPLTRSVRVLWTLHELGLPVDLERVDLMSGTQYSRDFRRRVNPNANVPVLQWVEEATGEQKSMFESAAIVRFLAERHHRLLPALDDPARPLFEQTFQWAASSVDMLLWQIRVMHDFRADAEADYLGEQYKRWNAVVTPQ